MAVRIRILKRYNFVAKVENEILVFGRVIHAKKYNSNISLGQVPTQLTAWMLCPLDS
jgi:hypothetical protein